MSPSPADVSNPAYVRARAMVTLFERLEHLCEGAIAIDRGGRVIYVNEKYLASLGLRHTADAIGRPIEEIIPNSLMRTVAESGEPILLDIMELGSEQLVVTRMPIEDEARNVIGAIGFVLYDHIESLKPLLARVTQLENDLRLARRQLSNARAARFTLADFVGATPDIAQAKDFAKRAARQNVTVLLTGETGTGKELLAQAIHNASTRAEKPFVSVNVAAIPETLIESEFFGTAPGAYTGADRRGREGKFRLADGGTLFLDEIGEMPLQLQAKLLRVLQEREIEPLGSDRITRVDVRVIAATNVDLRKRVSDGAFRADLYYRLNVLSIDLPPLRKCLDDLPDICAAARGHRRLQRLRRCQNHAERILGAGALRLAGQCSRAPQHSRARPDPERFRAPDRRRFRAHPARQHGGRPGPGATDDRIGRALCRSRSGVREADARTRARRQQRPDHGSGAHAAHLARDLLQEARQI